MFIAVDCTIFYHVCTLFTRSTEQEQKNLLYRINGPSPSDVSSSVSSLSWRPPSREDKRALESRLRTADSRLRTLKARLNVVEEELRELDEQMQAPNESASNSQLERALEDETELERGVRLGQLTPFAGSKLARSRLSEKRSPQSFSVAALKRVKNSSIKRSDSYQNSKSSKSLDITRPNIGMPLVWKNASIASFGTSHFNLNDEFMSLL